MRNIWSVLLLSLCLLTIGFAGEKKFGKKITLKEKTKISDIMANPEKFDGKKVLVEGAIVDVCQMKGCWIKIGSDKEFESMTFKVEDGVITFPMDVKGKSALAQGIVSAKVYTVEQLIEQGKETAKEQGKEFDPKSVKGPKTVIRINGEGAIVR
ncbi:MAG: DUF4920 domain-containing protein [Ignavibacteriales bacterium]|nr:DUF4920 domain-containing protein [Ignavibacteriales bacterium]